MCSCYFTGIFAHFQAFLDLNTPASTSFVNTGFPDVFPTNTAFSTDPTFPTVTGFPSEPAFPASFTTEGNFPVTRVPMGSQRFQTKSPLQQDPIVTVPSSPVTTPTSQRPSTTVVSTPVAPLSTIVPRHTAFISGKIAAPSMDFNQHFLPSIPTGRIFTNLISGVSSLFRPSGNWLSNGDNSGINEKINRPIQLTTNTMLTSRQQIRNTPATIVLTTQPPTGTNMFRGVKRPVVTVPDRSMPQTNVLASKSISAGNGRDTGAVLDREPGGVAIGVGASMGFGSLQPVKAPLPAVLRTQVRQTTGAPAMPSINKTTASPEQMLQRVQQGSAGT